MDEKTILSHVDHTLLKPEATWKDIMPILDDAIEYGCASACIPASFVKQAAAYVDGKLPICTVIGFPNGYSTKETKVFETADAVKNGASEIDMVVNIGDVKSGQYDKVQEEIEAIKEACEGKLLKVIVETCLLEDEEIARLCKTVADGGAEYIKTSTGFNAEGATPHAVKVMADNRPEGLKIKAAGGISSLEDAELYLNLGADRLGTSRIVKLVKANGH